MSYRKAAVGALVSLVCMWKAISVACETDALYRKDASEQVYP